jgi:hypothetical protein
MEEDRPQEETGLQHQHEDNGLFAFIWMVGSMESPDGPDCEEQVGFSDNSPTQRNLF